MDSPSIAETIITLATTALNALPTEINSTDSSYDEWGGGVVYDNGTVVSPVDGELIDEGSYILVSGRNSQEYRHELNGVVIV